MLYITDQVPGRQFVTVAASLADAKTKIQARIDEVYSADVGVVGGDPPPGQPPSSTQFVYYVREAKADALLHYFYELV